MAKTLSALSRPIGIVCVASDLDDSRELWLNRLQFDCMYDSQHLLVVHHNHFCIYIFQTDAPTIPISVPGARGIEHLALCCSDAKAAITHPCFSGLTLNTDNGQPFPNPDVWGGGTVYFDWISFDNTKIEICQRLCCNDKNKMPFHGISHIGIASSDFEKTCSFYQKLGFQLDPPLAVTSEADGRFLCTMAEKDSIWIEIYELLDLKEQVFGAGCMKGILFSCPDTEQLSEAAEAAHLQLSGTALWPQGKCLIYEGADHTHLYFLQENNKEG